MKIRMTKTRKGTEDGYVIKDYNEGEVYDVREHLGYKFLSEQSAVEVLDDSMLKAIDAINNKLLGGI